MAKMDKSYIFNKLDIIEFKTNEMIHHIPELKESMKLWQDNKLNDSYFSEILNKYLDEIEQSKQSHVS